MTSQTELLTPELYFLNFFELVTLREKDFNVI